MASCAGWAPVDSGNSSGRAVPTKWGMRRRYSEELTALAVAAPVAARALDVAADPAAPTGALAAIVACDPGLAARVLHRANAPVHGRVRRVGHLGLAVAVIGDDVLRALVLRAGLGVLSGDVATGPEGFWRHGVTTAAASGVVAEQVGASRRSAFHAGLLHDVGAAILHREDPEGFDRAALRPTPEAVEAAEVEAFGTTHAFVGAEALEAWRFPPAVVEAAALHQLASEVPCHALGRIVRAGEALAHVLRPGHDPAARAQAVTRLADVRIPQVRLDDLCRATEARLRELLAVLDGSQVRR